jgi:hypothetical protein
MSERPVHTEIVEATDHFRIVAIADVVSARAPEQATDAERTVGPDVDDARLVTASQPIEKNAVTDPSRFENHG